MPKILVSTVTCYVSDYIPLSLFLHVFKKHIFLEQKCPGNTEVINSSIERSDNSTGKSMQNSHLWKQRSSRKRDCHVSLLRLLLCATGKQDHKSTVIKHTVDSVHILVHNFFYCHSRNADNFLWSGSRNIFLSFQYTNIFVRVQLL